MTGLRHLAMSGGDTNLIDPQPRLSVGTETLDYGCRADDSVTISRHKPDVPRVVERDLRLKRIHRIVKSEDEMNALFRYTRDFVETLFEKSG